MQRLVMYYKNAGHFSWRKNLKLFQIAEYNFSHGYEVLIVKRACMKLGAQ